MVNYSQNENELEATEVQEEVTQEVAETPQEAIAQQSQKSIDEANAEALNWVKSRESISRLQRERDDAYAKYERLQREQAPPKPEPIHEDISLNDDDIAEGKHLKALQRKIKMLEEQNVQQQKQSFNATAELKLQAKYTDFNQVVTAESIRALTETDPEAAEALTALNGNLYLQGATAYKMIKNMETPMNAYLKDKERAQLNAVKPKPIASIAPQKGDSPLSKANAFSEGLTPELKKSLYKEMLEAAKGM